MTLIIKILDLVLLFLILRALLKRREWLKAALYAAVAWFLPVGAFYWVWTGVWAFAALFPTQAGIVKNKVQELGDKLADKWATR